MRIVDKQQIVAHIDLALAVQRIEEGFVAFSNGKVQVPPVQMFAFAAANGDCCVKSAFIEGSETFTVKVSTGFYDNPGKGLESNDGLMLVLSASDGQPLALLQDQGWLTGMRTALAGRIAARLMAPREVYAIGILGTGMQARMQLEQLRPVTACRRVIVWGRNDAELASYSDFAAELGFDVQVTREAKTLAEGANLIVCTTPSRAALLDSEWVRPGTHITAIGADAPGKQELDPLLVARADRIIVDSVVQCRQYGEVSHALKAGLIEEAQLGEIGALLDGRIAGRTSDDEITLVDLTGVAVQDAQIALCALQSL
ncbi:ornithine cyclodeaminase family protein [Pseudomonas berkeleyensis]|uniref:Ornithine cyclodeaminase family protein n=1 Tax=Pseudomonas berkeleyensis TaxID=2726956 RepID=A0A7G5DJG6_9PSED|nr:ornithine cyclodeaminase family protein [Pseudomonas berkeleyensis]QMV61891.1 ornithine cyclodeaminase family protein [Pseudomonas berkeleyensis]WSO37328.1 ornithine cyclodeaminase family protein [Pseudomonas berkeleyensis]